MHILHPYCTPKTLTQTPVYTCIHTKAQPKSPNKSISSLDWFFSVAARMEHPNMSEWMSEPNASNKADVSQGCQCQICHRHRVARRQRGAQPWNCSKFSSIIAVCHRIDCDNGASYIDQQCREHESCSLPVKWWEFWKGTVWQWGAGLLLQWVSDWLGFPSWKRRAICAVWNVAFITAVCDGC